jgi:uncharacterized BrkB/YihY/UPF0761 family membrane protein
MRCRTKHLNAMPYVRQYQKKKHSFAEATLGTLIGFVMSLAIGYVIYPHLNMKAHDGIFTATVVFTLLSVVRTYYVRRLFNYLHEKKIL